MLEGEHQDRAVKQWEGVEPEGGGVVEQETEQLGLVTARAGPHRAPGTDHQQSSSMPVPGSCRRRHTGDATTQHWQSLVTLESKKH